MSSFRKRNFLLIFCLGFLEIQTTPTAWPLCSFLIQWLIFLFTNAKDWMMAFYDLLRLWFFIQPSHFCFLGLIIFAYFIPPSANYLQFPTSKKKRRKIRKVMGPPWLEDNTRGKHSIEWSGGQDGEDKFSIRIPKMTSATSSEPNRLYPRFFTNFPSIIILNMSARLTVTFFCRSFFPVSPPRWLRCFHSDISLT